ncbi:MAG TPA: LacI family DNA-binding transcriptional regulator [Opitutaceae bacterium]|nr:LacI family DNA-binding transcriptional regulator [Opitutaceae bacterium]
MFTSSPRYLSLTQQVVHALETDILRGLHTKALPSVRQLAAQMQVSRRTISAAVGILQQKNLVRPTQRQGIAVLKRSVIRKTHQTRGNIGLLLPQPLDELHPYSTVFFHSLRALLYLNGFHLVVHSGPSFFSSRPASALQRLVTRHPSDCWILAFSSLESQAWFHAQGVPAVVAGTAHDAIPVPFVDVDFQATARHAANFLISRGHRHIGLVNPQIGKAGDRRTEAGFCEAAASYPSTEIQVSVFHHHGSMASLRSLAPRLMPNPGRPTALLVANPYFYMGLSGILQEKGVSIPEDLSIMCRDDDHCLGYMPTEPTRYVCRPEQRARAIFDTVMHSLGPKGRKTETKSVLLFPELIEGKSVTRRK